MMQQMTATEKHNVILNALAEAIAEKEKQITLCEWELSDVRRKLEKAEAELANAWKENAILAAEKETMKAIIDGKLCKKTIETRGNKDA